MQTFRAKLKAVPHGGQYVVVPARVAAAAGLAHRARVRGSVNGASYRSSLMMYSGVFHMGVHKASLLEAGVKPGSTVSVTIELDDQPLPGDVVPDDLRAALKKDPEAAGAWDSLAPSHRREHVRALSSAKQPETRARRLAKVLEMLALRRGQRASS